MHQSNMIKGYAAHVEDRDSEAKIAEHEIGYSHPLGSVVDVLLGGGRCYFTPSTVSGSCRKDNIDLLGWAKGKGFNVFTDRAGFDKLKSGSDAKLPYVGLFTQGILFPHLAESRTDYSRSHEL
jgi:alkaline phosphatase